MEKLAARPAIISDADSIESAISSPQAVLSGRGVMQSDLNNVAVLLLSDAGK